MLAVLPASDDPRTSWSFQEQEERFDDCIHLSVLIDAQTPYLPDPMTRPNLLQLSIKIERRSPIQHGHPLGISEDTIRAGQIVHAIDNPPVRSLPNTKDPSADKIPNMQDVLIVRWGEETQLYDRDVSEAYLATADWHMDEVVHQYISDMDQWRTHTQNSDVSMSTRYLRQWDFDISETVAA
jgi:hypothetical protein